MTIENSAILANAGITISLTADEGSRTAYLPATIGLLMRNGLSEEDAFKGVTINPAKTLGLEDRVGSGSGQSCRYRSLWRPPIQQPFPLPYEHH